MGRIYWRLCRTYALKHWGYVAMGVLFALLEGGSLLALFPLIGQAAGGLATGKLDDDTAPVEHIQPAEALKSSEDLAVQEVSEEEKDSLSKEERKARKKLEQFSKGIEKANGWLEKFGLPQIDQGDGEHLTRGMFIALLCALVFFFSLQALTMLGNRYCLKWLGARVVTDMRNSLFGHLLEQSQAYFSREDMGVGSLISRCTNDINAVEGVIANNLPELIVSPIHIAVATCFIIKVVVETKVIGWKFGVLLLLMVVVFFPIYALCRVLKKYQHRVLDNVSIVTDRMQECYSGIKVIRTFRQEEREKAAFAKVNESYFHSLRRAIRAEVAVHPILQIAAMVLVGVFLAMCYACHVGIALLASVGYAAQSAYKPIKDLVKLMAALQKGAAAAERFFDVMDTNSTLPVPENPRHIHAFHDKIHFDNVSFRYKPGGEEILKGIDVTLRKGEMLALVGQTGSGKSTIANLLARFYDPSQGRITIDGVDLKELDVTDFRQMVGMVSQDTFLFNTTIEENIRYGRPEATHEEVVEAARQANALEFIENFPEGFQRKVGERGDLLSGGQKQRVAIARAILRNPPILILDEATSALDTVTEKLVQDALNNVMKDRTVLAIAHRLSTVRSASCILVLENGQVMEAGTDAELRQRGGIYSRLAELQFKEE